MLERVNFLCCCSAPAAAAGVGAKNVFDNAIVIADEVHNLLIRLNSNQCKLLPHQVQTATNPTMIGLAGTPSATDYDQGKATVDRANSHDELPHDDRRVSVCVMCSVRSLLEGQLCHMAG